MDVSRPVDFFHIRGQIWLDAAGDPIHPVEHVEHTYSAKGSAPSVGWCLLSK
jgi:hypothetical protein